MSRFVIATSREKGKICWLFNKKDKRGLGLKKVRWFQPEPKDSRLPLEESRFLPNIEIDCRTVYRSSIPYLRLPIPISERSSHRHRDGLIIIHQPLLRTSRLPRPSIDSSMRGSGETTVSRRRPNSSSCSRRQPVDQVTFGRRRSSVKS